MILSDREFLRRMETGELVIRPRADECIQPASYDLRVGEDVSMEQGAVTLVHSMEWIELPADLAATLRCRSSYARKGVSIGGGYVDPGFRGQLTLCLLNSGKGRLHIKEGERVVQMILHEVIAGTRTYQGRYQDSAGTVTSREKSRQMEE